MSTMIPILCGTVGGLVASILGFSPNELLWWMVFSPWVLLAVLLT